VNVQSVEARWRDAWRAADQHRAPDSPIGSKFYNFDSGPFPNGPLHLGHVRTYVLGDVTARYQRLRGKSVLYATEWDAFGLPNEQGALAAGATPHQYTADNIRAMRSTLERLGISYDWSRVHATCDPAYYRWTQWLFLAMFRAGLVYCRKQPVAWCSTCDTSLSSMQVVDGRCWRCGDLIEQRVQPQWYIAISRFDERLQSGVNDLSEWSGTARKLALRGLPSPGDNTLSDAADWPVSRPRAWGAPLPLISCPRCGFVPAERLPVRLPESLDWRLGSKALSACESFRRVRCPSCGSAAERVTDTLDCFFDDCWSYLACVATFNEADDFPGAALAPWLPVDKFHSGYDTFAYLNLYRLIGLFAHDLLKLPTQEPFTSYTGHNVVLAGGKKMSKSLGNAVAADVLMDRVGADVLRLAVLWAAGPERAVDASHLDWRRAQSFHAEALALCGDALSPKPFSSTVAEEGRADRYRAAWQRVGRFIEEYRPHAAIEELSYVLKDLRGRAWEQTPRRSIAGFAAALSPLAPFLAAEITARFNDGATLCKFDRRPV
jgi:leucyl-tRNA synthetase